MKAKEEVIKMVIDSGLISDPIQKEIFRIKLDLIEGEAVLKYIRDNQKGVNPIP